jgi:ubiquinone/menaquinone biosynthesis C-methylase UbiE
MSLCETDPTTCNISGLDRYKNPTGWTYRQSDERPSSLWPDLYIFSRLPKRSRIIDIGCGVGQLGNHLAGTGHYVVGIDLDGHSLGIAQKTRDCPSAQYVLGSAAHMPFCNSNFDIAVVQAVLTMVEKPQTRRAILSEAARVVKPDGLLYMAEFAQNWNLAHYRERYIADEPLTGEMGMFHVRDKNGNVLFKSKHFTRREIVEMLSTTGFEIDSLRVVPFETYGGVRVEGFQVIAKKAGAGR